MKLKHLTTALLVPLLGACSLWVNYEQPETPKPEAFIGPMPAPEAKAPIWPDVKWWDNFKSNELSEYMAQAHAANFDMKAAAARIHQADAQRRIAGAPLLPALDLNAGAQRSQQSASLRTVTTATGTTSSSKGSRYNAFNTGLNASYELDFWGKNSAALAAAEADLNSNIYDAETIRLTVESSVANTYFDMLATKARLATAQQNEKNAQDVLDAINLRFKVGVANGLDVAQQQNIVAAQTVAVAPLELQLRKDQDAMAILLGKLPESMTVPNGNLQDIAIPSVAPGLPSELLLRRPDVQNAEAQLIAADANIVNARAQFFPSIALTAQGGYQSQQLNQLFQPGSMIWSIGTSLAQPIFEGGALQGNLDVQKAVYEELLQNYRKSVLSSFSDVEDALANVAQSAAQEKAQEQATASARNAFALSQAQFKGGIIDITTMLDTQRTLFSAEDTLLQIRLAHLEAVVQLYNALGGGWKKPGSETTETQTRS